MAAHASASSCSRRASRARRGDIGNPQTFAFPVRYRTVRGRVAAARRRRARPRAARAVHRRGARARARGVAAVDDELRLPRPRSSARWRRRCGAGVDVEPAARRRDRGRLGDGRRVGVVTADAASLTAEHLRAVGARADTPIEGLRARLALSRAPLLDDRAELDVDEAAHGDRRGRAAPGRAPSRRRRDRPRVHQHAALRRRRARGDRPAGARHHDAGPGALRRGDDVGARHERIARRAAGSSGSTAAAPSPTSSASVPTAR